MSVRGELVEMLAKALSRARRGANDRGIVNRVRDVGEGFMDEASPDYVRGDWAPHNLWRSNNDYGVHRANPLGQATWNDSMTAQERYRAGMMAANWDLNPESQAKLDALPPLSRARFLAEHGEPHALNSYERTLLRRNNPTEASRLMWGMEDEPSLEFTAAFSPGDLSGLTRADGSLAPPEEFLGRPLTPDHIWNDPRFQDRMAQTRDLDGIRTPEERFRIAAEREQMAQSGPRGVAAARWGVDNPVVKMLLLGGAGLGGGLSLRQALSDRMNA